MAKRDHDPFPIDPVRGLYMRGDIITPPPGYLSSADNLSYSIPGIEHDTDFVRNTVRARVREQFDFASNLPAIAVRFYVYTKSSGNRIILLDSTGQFWDAVSGTVIVHIAGAVDFHGITLNDRFYFTPHDRETGLSGQFVHIYDPNTSALARKAAGSSPVGTLSMSASAVAGKIEPGLHIVAVSYVFDSGFITRPSLHVQYTAPSPRKKLSLSIIPIGPAGVVARIIWMSHVVIGFNGNLLGPELFKAYTIENNTSTSLLDTIDVYDIELIDSADPYIDTLQEIPAGTFLTDLDGRLIVCGSFDSPHTLRISNQNEPENIDSVDGIREVIKGRGGGIKTTRPLRGNLIWWKRNMTGILRNDAELPLDWSVEEIDSALGAEVYGVSETPNATNMFYDVYLVANNLGLLVFNGSYVDVLKPLTLNIQSLWRCSCSRVNIDRMRVLVDSINYRVYVLITDEDDIVNWFVGDFADGLTADAIKWSVWNFEYSATLFKNFIDAHIVIDPAINDNSTTLLAIVDDDNGLRELITNTFTSGADFDGDITARFGIKISDPEFRDIHLQSVRMILSSSQRNSVGHYKISIAGETVPFDPPTTDNMVEAFFNQTDRIINIELFAASGDLCVSLLIPYVKVVAQDRSY